MWKRFKQEMSKREAHFWALVSAFERDYPILITSMALQLGTLFKRDEYPDPRTITSKFGFRPQFSPVPEAGDFRVDVAADALPWKGTVFDITPTVLSMFGLPVGQDMSGQALTRLLNQRQRDTTRVAYVPTWEKGEPHAALPLRGLDEERMRQLRGLGYIE